MSTLQERVKQKRIEDKIKLQREKRIQNAIKKAEEQKIHSENSQNKKGKIQKIKYLRKKTYETVIQQSKPKAIQLPQNITPQTFLIRSSQYKKCYQQCKKHLVIDQQKGIQISEALQQFATSNHEKLLEIKMQLLHPIEFQPHPFRIQLSSSIPAKNIVLICKFSSTELDQYLKNVKNINLQAMSLGQFKKKINNRDDKRFFKSINCRRTHVYCQFDIYKENYKAINSIMLSKSIPIFPIYCKKVPFFLKERFHDNLEAYLENLMNHAYVVLKGGSELVIKLPINKQQNPKEMFMNIEDSVYQMVSQCFRKNSVKGNKIKKIELKTENSIGFVLYQC